jgi:hypothetical protein
MSFEGIPPFATNCELRISIPPEAFLYYSRADRTGNSYPLTNPLIAVYQAPVDISQSSTWTFETFSNLSPLNGIAETGNPNEYTTLEFNAQSIDLIFATDCPGVESPSGGAITYAFMIFPVTQDLDGIQGTQYSSAQVVLGQDYSDPLNLIGVYYRYQW